MKLRPLAVGLSLASGLAIIAAAPVASAQVQLQFSMGRGAQAPQRFMQMTPTQSAGTVARYLVGPFGGVRGFMLNNGVTVMFHGPTGQQMAQRIPVGQSVRVDGFAHPSNPSLIHRATVSGPNGIVIVDQPRRMTWGLAPGARMGAPGAPPPIGAAPQNPTPPSALVPGGAPMIPGVQQLPPGMMMQRRMARFGSLPQRTVQGTVTNVIATGRGAARMVLLSDGTTVLLGRPMAMSLMSRGIRVGETLRVTGRGNATAQGSGLFAEEIVFSDGTRVAAPMGMGPMGPVGPMGPAGPMGTMPPTGAP